MSQEGDNRQRRRQGFTLIELVVVVAILAVVAGLVIMNVAGVNEHAEKTVAAASLHAVREALCGGPSGPGYLNDMKHEPDFDPAVLRIHDLLSTNFPGHRAFDPLTVRGWRGPYVRTEGAVRNTNADRGGLFPAADERRWSGDTTFQARGFYAADGGALYGSAGDLAVADPWGNPIVLQIPQTNLLYARVLSAGSDGVLDTPPDVPVPDADSRGDDLLLFLNRADGP
jgi:prepilin-type N-terminal cleavage/methylation domain-containing protein